MSKDTEVARSCLSLCVLFNKCRCLSCTPELLGVNQNLCYPRCDLLVEWQQYKKPNKTTQEHLKSLCCDIPLVQPGVNETRNRLSLPLWEALHSHKARAWMSCNSVTREGMKNWRIIQSLQRNI